MRPRRPPRPLRLVQRQPDRPIAQLIPAEVPLGFRQVGQLHGPMVDGDPTHLSVFGDDGQGRRGVVVTMEWPERYQPKGKLSNEQLHLDRFIVDARWGLGDPVFENARPGPDPPDFIVEAAGNEIGLDVTQFVLRDRAEAFNILRRLQTDALTRGPRRFKHLRGHVCYVMFVAGFPKRHGPEWEAALDALERVRPPQPPPKVLDDLTPQAMEMFDGGVVSAGPLKTASGRSTFYNVMGFELAYPFTTVIYEDEAYAHFQHLIEKHDKPGVSQLLVSISAPVAEGWAFASDGLAASLAAGLALTQPLSADHIERVWLHIWPSRAINVLTPNTPGVEHLCAAEPPPPSGMTLRMPSFGEEPEPELTDEERDDWEQWMLSRFGPSIE